MGREYERLFEALPGVHEPTYLCERVFGAVSRERVRILRRRLVFSSCTALLSLAGVVAAGRALIEAMRDSGFSSYASLLISDSSVVLGTGKIFLLSLLESLPGPEAVVTLALLAVLIQSLRVLIATGAEWTFRPALA